MEREARGNIFQDDHFIFTEFNGLKLQQLVVCENPKTKETIMVFIKVENNNWHQFFLDVGFGFWQDWNETEIDDDDEEYNYIDKTIEFDIYNKTISKIYCEPHENNCQIIIELESNEKLILRTTEPKIFDSLSELIKLGNK